jgi:hypothetical protein
MFIATADLLDYPKLWRRERLTVRFRKTAFYEASAIAQGANIVRKELGLPATYVPAADPALQIDVVPGRRA